MEMEILQLMVQYGIAGAALYMMYDLSSKALARVKDAVEDNTDAIRNLAIVIESMKR